MVSLEFNKHFENNVNYNTSVHKRHLYIMDICVKFTPVYLRHILPVSICLYINDVPQAHPPGVRRGVWKMFDFVDLLRAILSNLKFI